MNSGRPQFKTQLSEYQQSSRDNLLYLPLDSLLANTSPS